MAVQVSQMIKHNGKWYNAGDYIDSENISKKEIKRLLTKGVGKEVALEISKEKDNTRDDFDLDPPGGDDESLEEILDLNFNTDELKEGATTEGLQFPGNISKKKIIELIIENGKTDYFIDQLES